MFHVCDFLFFFCLIILVNKHTLSAFSTYLQTKRQAELDTYKNQCLNFKNVFSVLH